MVLPLNGVQKLLLKAYPELRSQAIMLHPWRDLIGQLEVRVTGIRFVAMCNGLRFVYGFLAGGLVEWSLAWLQAIYARL